MRYRIRHETLYAYADRVDLASHMLHLSPRLLPGQQVFNASIHAEPRPSRMSWGLDHFGNQVCWLFLDHPHERFSVTVQADVAVSFAPPPMPSTRPSSSIGGCATAIRRSTAGSKR